MSAFQNFTYHPILALPQNARVLDMSQGPQEIDPHEFAIGKYNEVRPGIYTTAIFEGVRNIHVGIDIFAPVGTALSAFEDGWFELKGYNSAPGDYGATLITGHKLNGQTLYALWGHLNLPSIEKAEVGQMFKRGEVIAQIGDRHENGGWNPHVHFQLCRYRPEVPDLPGVVSKDQLAQALLDFPDPRQVLGPLY